VSNKHAIDGYTELSSLQLAGRIIILAEYPGADEPYLVVNCKWDNPMGANEYYAATVTANYFDAMREFIKREAMQLSFIEAERSLSGLPIHVMTAADCIPDSMRESLVGKIVLVKPEALSPEYRSAEHQIGLCTGGFGAHPGAGRTILCKMLHSGDQLKHERQQIAGVVDPAKLPEWAVTKLVELRKVPTLADELAEAKGKAARQKAEPGGEKREKGHSPEER
jgi:hypothetical protein